jgi:glycosyltransferase involved in cell wall biosynthesis
MDELANSLAEVAEVSRFTFSATYQRRTRVIGAVLDFRQQREIANLFVRNAPDIIHVNQQVAEDGVDLVLAARSSGLPWISTIHIGRSAASLGALMGPARDRVAVAALRRAGGPFIAVSHASRTQLSERFGERQPPIAVVHNGVHAPSAALLATSRISARAEWGADAHEVVIGAAGRLEPQKDPLALVNHVASAAKRSKIRLAWIGDGSLRDAFKAYAAASGIPLVIDGWRRDATTRVAGLDIFLLPSRFEGLPLALLEAMHAGLPVVAARSDGITEAVESGLTGYTCAAPSEWRKAALQLATDTCLRERLGATAKAVAAERFSAKAMARATLSLYREILHSGSYAKALFASPSARSTNQPTLRLPT